VIAMALDVLAEGSSNQNSRTLLVLLGLDYASVEAMGLYLRDTLQSSAEPQPDRSGPEPTSFGRSALVNAWPPSLGSAAPRHCQEVR